VGGCKIIFRSSFIYADSAQPSPTDWHGFTLAGDSNFDDSIYLFNNATTPAVAWTSVDHGLTFSKSNAVFPTSSSNWTDQYFTEGQGIFYDGALVSGVPVILAYLTSTSLLIADSPEPTDTSSWDQYELPVMPDFDTRRITSHGDYPAIIATDTIAPTDIKLIYLYPY
jgi:hypothetical protein